MAEQGSNHPRNKSPLLRWLLRLFFILHIFAVVGAIMFAEVHKASLSGFLTMLAAMAVMMLTVHFIVKHRNSK